MLEPLKLVGERFGNLTVIELAERRLQVDILNDDGDRIRGGGTILFWRCRCDCGEEVIRCTAVLRNWQRRNEEGWTKYPMSCGCQWRIPKCFRKER